MNFVSRNESLVTIRQIPFFLWFASGLLSLPFLAYSLFLIMTGTDADGKYFCLVLGLFLSWFFLEFVVTRECFKVDLVNKVLTRKVNGVFRHKEQVINLREMKGIRLEKKAENGSAKKFHYLYIYGGGKEFQINNSAIRYLNHDKLGKLLGEVTGIPYQGELFKVKG